ncbi:MAG TPA: hypothetical protein VHB77_13735 [Planctomycetaceae bacterium]|nr:hypothetical protein [Planctomycetaceae bacterium]
MLRTTFVLLAVVAARFSSLQAAEFVELSARGEVAPELGTQAEIPERFRLPAGDFAYQTQFERLSGPVRVSKITFPTPVSTDIAENNTVHAHYFQPAGEGPFPGVIVLHILGGDFELSQTIANSLARRGVAALFV